MPLSQVGTALKKLMPKYRIKRYGCKTLGELYERLDRYRARQDGERGGGDGEKEKRLLSYHLRLNVEKQASFGGLLFKDKKSLFWSQVDTGATEN